MFLFWMFSKGLWLDSIRNSFPYTYEVHTISFQTFRKGTFIDSTHMKL